MQEKEPYAKGGGVSAIQVVDDAGGDGVGALKMNLDIGTLKGQLGRIEWL